MLADITRKDFELKFWNKPRINLYDMDFYAHISQFPLIRHSNSYTPSLLALQLLYCVCLLEKQNFLQNPGFFSICFFPYVFLEYWKY